MEPDKVKNAVAVTGDNGWSFAVVIICMRLNKVLPLLRVYVFEYVIMCLHVRTRYVHTCLNTLCACMFEQVMCMRVWTRY